MIQLYTPPTRWWRRSKQVRLTVWPMWLAQLLCPHLNAKWFMGMVTADGSSDEDEDYYQCEDCYKIIQKRDRR